MLCITRASIVAMALALMASASATAMPITFEFTGVITDVGWFGSSVAVGDPFVATLSYDSDSSRRDNGQTSRYRDFSFVLQSGAMSWLAGPELLVCDGGECMRISNPIAPHAEFELRGPDLLPPGGALPTSLDLALATIAHRVFAQPTEHALAGNMYGDITSIRQTQGPGVPVPEPASLMLSVIGLAAAAIHHRWTDTQRSTSSALMARRTLEMSNSRSRDHKQSA
jgi:hypothetical protein